MTKDQVRQQILDVGVVPVIRASSPQKAIAAAEAVLAGGISVVEITMTVPRAKEAIVELSKNPELIVGAGTVLNAEAARQCFDAGAQFLIWRSSMSPSSKRFTGRSWRRSSRPVSSIVSEAEVASHGNASNNYLTLLSCLT